MPETTDILVIGGGIAGCSAAAELAADAGVILLEKEAHPGYHSTGRSAAFYAPAYGNAVVQGLTGLSAHFFKQQTPGFSDTILLRARGCLFIARPEQLPQLRATQQENASLSWLSAQQAVALQPLLSPSYVAAGLNDDSGGDLDVDAILQGYLRLFRRRGGRVLTAAEVTGLQFTAGAWQVHTSAGDFRAPILVNAAGAWADPVAVQAGLEPIGIRPKRRTAVLIDIPSGHDGRDWPMVVDADEAFYFKPDAGQLLLSPADETPSPPCDAQPEELDVALAVDWFERVTGRRVQRVNHRWAGLRSFAPDNSFVVGFDPRASGFFWLAGQGGYGVQSAPAMAQLARALITGAAPAVGFSGVMEYREAVAPERLLR